MEISDVRRRVVETIERAKRTAAEHRARVDEATADYGVFLERRAVPVFRQIANVLRAHGHAFTVFTPGGSVRLASDRTADDFIELFLETAGDTPIVVGHTSRHRGRRIVETEQPVAPGAVRDVTEEAVLEFVLKELEGLVAR
jgi:hypothetical protein